MATSITLDLDGPVHLIDHGGEGRAILLIHGLGGSHVNWSAVGDALIAYGSVRAIDLIGFGRTEPKGRIASVENQRDLVISYLREHGDGPATLIGNSMGGLTSLLVAAKAPELVHSLVLLDPALPTIRPRLDRDVLVGLLRPLMPGGQRAYAKMLQNPEATLAQTSKLVFAESSEFRPEDRAAALAMARERSDMPWAGQSFAEASRSMFKILIRRSAFKSMIESIEAPALLIHGDEDRLVDIASARWLSALRPDWQFEVFEGVGHVPQLEVPDRLLAAIGAWDQMTTTAASVAEVSE